MDISIILWPHNINGTLTSRALGPQALIDGGLVDKLEAQGHKVVSVDTIELTEEEAGWYGARLRTGTAGGHLADMVAEKSKNSFVLTLLSNCNGLMGVLGGLQAPVVDDWPRRVGLAWIDAHGDYNTPETSLSGMLGGMPVAISAGKCLHNFRKMNKLNVPIQAPDIIMMGMRDLDPLEREMMDESGMTIIREKDLQESNDKIDYCMSKLEYRNEVIDVHVDLDILDPSVAPAAGLPTAGGLTGKELGKALKQMLKNPKTINLSIASYSSQLDEDGGTLKEVMDGILGGMEGLLER